METLKVLNISLVSAVLVIMALGLMWAMILLIVRLTSPKKELAETDTIVQDDKAGNLESKHMAAAAALAVAIALLNTSFAPSSHRDMETLSPWQTAHRNPGGRKNISSGRRNEK